MKVKVTYKGVFELPKHETELSAGLDLIADFSGIESREDVKVFDGAYASGNWSKEQLVTLPPHSRVLIPTRIFMELPKGYEAQIRPRSGLALKQGLSIMNSPGTIDADYRGEVGVIITNQGLKPIIINHGDKIAQMVVAKHEQVEWVQEELSKTERGEGGFGSTSQLGSNIQLTPSESDKFLVQVLSESEQSLIIEDIKVPVDTDELKITIDQTSKTKAKGKKDDSNK